MPDAKSSHLFTLRRWGGWMGVIIVLDQLSKWWILHALLPGEPVRLTSFFKLVRVFNPGAAFSFLAAWPDFSRWFFIVLALLVMLWLWAMLRQHARERLLPLALACIMGGAIGNVIDRLAHGAVVDFLYFHYQQWAWPAFNLADSAITLGVVLMLWSQFFGSQAQGKTP